MTERFEPNRNVIGRFNAPPERPRRSDGQPNPLASLDIRPAILTSGDGLSAPRLGWATMREGEQQPLTLMLDGRQAGLPAGTIEFPTEESIDTTDIQYIRANRLTP